MTEIERLLLDELKKSERREKELHARYLSEMRKMREVYENELKQLTKSYKVALERIADEPVEIELSGEFPDYLQSLEKRLTGLEEQLEELLEELSEF